MIKRDPRDPRRDAYLTQVLSRVGQSPPASDERMRQLNEQIVAATAAMLREREANQRSIWDYAESWSAVLLPIGTLTAIAAGLCLFVLSARREPQPIGLPSARVALLSAATNRESSQRLVDLLVSVDRAAAEPGRR